MSKIKLYKFKDLSESSQNKVIEDYLSDTDYLQENNIKNITYEEVYQIHLDFGNDVLFLEDGSIP